MRDISSWLCWLIGGPALVFVAFVMLRGWPLTRNKDDGS